MPGFKNFRTGNNLFQKDIADFLEVSVAFISAVERGMAKLSGDKLALLLENPKGWDPQELLTGSLQKVNNFQNQVSGDHAIGGNDIGTLNITGISEDEVKRRIKQETALLRKDLEMEQRENLSLREEILYLREQNKMLLSLIHPSEQEG